MGSGLQQGTVCPDTLPEMLLLLGAPDVFEYERQARLRLPGTALMEIQKAVRNEADASTVIFHLIRRTLQGALSNIPRQVVAAIRTSLSSIASLRCK